MIFNHYPYLPDVVLWYVLIVFFKFCWFIPKWIRDAIRIFWKLEILLLVNSS